MVLPPEVEVVDPPDVEVEVVEPPDVEDVVPPEVEEVVVEPPLEVDVVEPPEVDDVEPPLLLLELDLELFVDLVDLVDLVKVPLFVDLQKMKHLLALLFDALVLFEKKEAFASVGVPATTVAVASVAPITAALVSLVYCISPSFT